MRWTRQRFARDGIAGLVERLVSGHRHADERCCCGRQNRVVLTPRRWRQVRGVASAQPGLDKTYPLMTVAREPGHRGARNKPLKPLRAGMPGDSGVLVYSCAFYQCKAHTRLRVQRAPGVPHALLGAEDKCIGSGASRGEIVNLDLDENWYSVIASGAKQSILSLLRPWIASLRSQ